MGKKKKGCSRHTCHMVLKMFLKDLCVLYSVQGILQAFCLFRRITKMLYRRACHLIFCISTVGAVQKIITVF